MRRLTMSLAILASLTFGLVPPAAAASPWTTVTLVFRADDGAAALARAATASVQTATSRVKPKGESPNYKLLPGDVYWHEGKVVDYRITNAPFKAAERAVVKGEKEVDQYVTTRKFKDDDRSSDINPCTGQPNTITWAPIDRPGGLLARTDLCINIGNHEIGGFVTTFDSLDGWAHGADGDLSTYDVENVATHEWGHIAGLDVVSAPEDACLTMYFQTTPEETEQRTLGWGDKRGLDALYHSGDTKPGPGCGK